MPGKLDLYAIGQGGINVVADPFELKANEATLLQNVIFPTSSGSGALQKRGGLTRANASAINSGASVLSMFGLSSADPYPTSSRYLYAAYKNSGTQTWARTLDGTTWVAVDSPLRTAMAVNTTTWRYGRPMPGLFPPIDGGYFYYPSDQASFVASASTYSLINKWDGTTDALVIQVPKEPQNTSERPPLIASCVFRGELYFSTLNVDVESGHTQAFVFKFNQLTGKIDAIGGQILSGANPLTTIWALCSYNGKLWAGGAPGSTSWPDVGAIFSIDPDIDVTLDTTSKSAWTQSTVTLEGSVVSLISFNGLLYAGTFTRNVAKSLRVYQQSIDGVWSSVKAVTGTATSKGTQLAVFNSTLFACINGVIYKSTDGSAWSTDLTVTTLNAAFDGTPGVPKEFGGALYWPFGYNAGSDGYILKRTTAGVWSTVLTNSSILGQLTTLDVAA